MKNRAKTQEEVEKTNNRVDRVPSRSTFALTVTIQGADEGQVIRRLRAALKHLLRAWGIRCVSVLPGEPDATDGQQITQINRVLR